MIIYPENDFYIEATETETFTQTASVPDVTVTAGRVETDVSVPDVEVDITVDAHAVLDLSELAVALHDELRYAGLLIVDGNEDVPWASTDTAHQNRMFAVVKKISETIEIQLEIEHL